MTYTPTPLISIIIPIFDNWELTKNCLVSIKEHTDVPYEVIVIDNGSTDATATELTPFGTALFGAAFIPIRFETNNNFGPACNAGARVARCSVLFFLNNDTIVTTDWAQPLLDALHSQSIIGAVGPLLLFENDTVQHMGIDFGTAGVGHLYQHFPREHAVVKKSRYVQGLTGAALMIHKNLFEKIGQFFEGYCNGFEDVELSLQMGKLGKRLKYIPNSVIYHLESQSVTRKDAESHNNILLFERCGDLWHIDSHHHALRDGFQVVWDAHYSLSAILTQEDEARLNALYAQSSVQEMHSGVIANPLWQGGAEKTVSVLEQHGRLVEACSTLVRSISFYSTFSKLKWALRLATAAKLYDLSAIIEKRFADAVRFTADPMLVVKKLHGISNKALQADDHFLLQRVGEASQEQKNKHIVLG